MSEMQQAAVAAKKSKMSVRDICYAGLFAAVIAVMAQISIPMPMGVPMTMQTFAITLAAVVLPSTTAASKLSTISSLIYIIMGAVGLPVLANFSGGFDKFVGPTGGFLISFPLMAFIIGWGAEHRKDFKGAYVIALIVGTVINYVIGVALFCAVAKASVATGITACVLPFIPTAIIKAILASVIGFAIKARVPEAVLVFVAASSLDAVRQRLIARGDVSPVAMEERLKRAVWECSQAEGYDYIVLNDDVDHAVRELRAIMVAEKCKTVERIHLLKEEF